MRTIHCIFMVVVLLLPAAGCNDSSSVLDLPRADPVVVFTSGADALAAAAVAPVDVRGVSVHDKLLFLEVGYRGGCAEHRFALHVSSAFLESVPPQAVLVLSHDDAGDGCAEDQIAYVTFDLSELERVYRESYRSGGPLRLQVFAPGALDPFRPLPLFDF